MTSIIHDYDPSLGCAFQGDVSIIPIPPSISIDRSDEISPVEGRLILMEGEVTGHHHAIALMERPEIIDGPRSKAADRLMADALAGKIAVPTAKLYRDPKATEKMRRLGIITRTDLVVAVLVVETGPMCLSHEEHDTIRIPHADGSVVQPNLTEWPGGYTSISGHFLIGRQVESAGAEERRVVD